MILSTLLWPVAVLDCVRVLIRGNWRNCCLVTMRVHMRFRLFPSGAHVDLRLLRQAPEAISAR